MRDGGQVGQDLRAGADVVRLRVGGVPVLVEHHPVGVLRGDPLRGAHGLVGPYYPRDWHLHRSAERYLETVLARATEISEDAARPGDVVLYRFGRAFAHGAIVLDPEQAGRVGAGIVLAAKASAERELRSQSLHGELHAPEAQK